jgi:hypothetical protein
VICSECFTEIDVTDLEPGDLIGCDECGCDLELTTKGLITVEEREESDVEHDEEEEIVLADDLQLDTEEEEQMEDKVEVD